ncbi:MAG: site-specific integrase [Chloroflexi bacterium]|nr:MAG: site-specific integrase [Chloroflexota bacterium]
MGIKPYKRRRRRDHKPTGRRLTINEVKQLRRVVNTNRLKGKRDRAILDLMLYAGLREAEVCTLTFDSIHQSDGRFWLTIQGKGHKTRRIKIHDTLYSSLQSWLHARQEITQKPNEVETAVSFSVSSPQFACLFSGLTRHSKLTHRPLTTATIRRIVAEYGRFANLAPRSGPNRLSPHDLRRTCARNAYDNGAPLPKIQKMLGHASIETTMRYIGSDDDETETAVDFVHY